MVSGTTIDVFGGEKPFERSVVVTFRESRQGQSPKAHPLHAKDLQDWRSAWITRLITVRLGLGTPSLHAAQRLPTHLSSAWTPARPRKVPLARLPHHVSVISTRSAVGMAPHAGPSPPPKPPFPPPTPLNSASRSLLFPQKKSNFLSVTVFIVRLNIDTHPKDTGFRPR